MIQLTKSEFHNATYQVLDPRPEKERRAKADTKLFWCLWVPLGAVFGFFACIVGDSGGYFVPVWGISTFVLWAAFGRSSE
jgi:hypothetical protein